MARLSQIHALDGPSPAEQVVSELSRQVQTGQLVPGEIIHIGEVAEQHGVRREPLQMYLESRQGDVGIILRGDSAEVAPLDLADCRSAYRLRNLIAENLLTRSAELIDPAQVASLLGEIGDGATSMPTDRDTSAQVIARLLKQLCEPAASRAEARSYHDLCCASDRYFFLGYRAIAEQDAGITDGELKSLREARLHELVDCVTRRDLRLAIGPLRKLLRNGQRVAELSFDWYASVRSLRVL